ncbi:unnamed protein product, partial [Brassica rapa]
RSKRQAIEEQLHSVTASFPTFTRAVLCNSNPAGLCNPKPRRSMF